MDATNSLQASRRSERLPRLANKAASISIPLALHTKKNIGFRRRYHSCTSIGTTPTAPPSQAVTDTKIHHRAEDQSAPLERFAQSCTSISRCTDLPEDDTMHDMLTRQGYTAITRICKGSFGITLRMQSRDSSQLVCKSVDVSQASSEEVQGMLTELHTLKQCKHPYVVKFQTSFIDGGWLCILMDFCSSGSLAEKIEAAKSCDQPLDETLIIKWLTQAMLALQYIHMWNVIHRNLKPSNVFLSRNGDLKIGDFGITKFLDLVQTSSWTNMCQVMKHIHYMSPEVCQGETAQCPTDVWAMGCILYESCSLKVPFDATSYASLLKQISEGPAPVVPCTYSTFLQRVCMKMLKRRPEDRPSIGKILQHQSVQSILVQLWDGGAEACDESRRDALIDENVTTPRSSVAKAAFESNAVADVDVRLLARQGKVAATTPIKQLCSTAAAAISLSMTTALSAHGGVGKVRPSDSFRSEEEEAMRQLYLRCITVDPAIIFSELAVPLKNELVRNASGSQLLHGSAKSVTVAFEKTVSTIDKEVFSIGRKPFCDVQVSRGDLTVSRMHLWVFNLPGGIVVVDGWSCSGTSVADWECGESARPASRPGARCAFILPHDEAATLRLGCDASVTFNPKLCVICLERPRALHFPCGHQAICRTCVFGEQGAHLKECPCCRAPINYEEIREFEGACVGHTYAVVK